MLHLILSLLQISLEVSFERFLIFKFLFHLNHLRVEFPNDIILLLLRKLLSFRLNMSNWVFELHFQIIQYRFVPSFNLITMRVLAFTTIIWFITRILIIQPNSQLPLQFFNILPVILLSHYIPILSPQNIIFDLFIFFDYFLHF